MALKNLSLLSKHEVKAFIDSVETVLADCDGVLWLENVIIGGAPVVMNRLRELGKKIFLVSNNSTKSRNDFVVKANKMGIISKKEEILSTAYLASDYLKTKNFKKTVYVVGMKGIAEELDLIGIKHMGIGPDVLQTDDLDELVESVKLDPEVAAVIVGFDLHFSFPKMLKASSYLRDPACDFIAVSNTPSRFPMNTHLSIPATSSVVASICTCTGREPFVVGKPFPFIADVLTKEHKVDPKKTLIIGDVAKIDILLGRRCGFQTLLVLSGITTLEEVSKWKESKNKDDLDSVPDYYLEKLGDLLPFLK